MAAGPGCAIGAIKRQVIHYTNTVYVNYRGLILLKLMTIKPHFLIDSIALKFIGFA